MLAMYWGVHAVCWPCTGECTLVLVHTFVQMCHQLHPLCTYNACAAFSSVPDSSLYDAGVCVFTVHFLIHFKIHFFPESIAVIIIGESPDLHATKSSRDLCARVCQLSHCSLVAGVWCLMSILLDFELGLGYQLSAVVHLSMHVPLLVQGLWLGCSCSL